MNALLVQGSLKLPINSLRSEFPKETGLYLVDDGSTFQIVVIDDTMDDDYMPFGFIVPRDSVIKEYERIGERDIDLLQKQLSELNKGIQDNISDQFDMFNKVLNSLDNGSQKGGGSNIDLEQIIKLIAVAQKPDLLKQ